ncbi:MAG: VanZ family protein [Muribaculaceae bacterium]|nr:VanZ family protein [Muribaculaceae bacterium]
MFKKIIQAIPIGVCSGVIILLIAYFSLVPHPVGSGMLTFKHADKVAHDLMYFVATCVFVLDYARYKNPHHTRISFELMLMCASMVLGLVLEVLQLAITDGQREFDVNDIIANCIGAFMGFLFMRLWGVHMFRRTFVHSRKHRHHHRRHNSYFH